MWIALGACGMPVASTAKLPNILLVTVDTLRTDRMSSYGHERLTSPHIDELLASGARFAQARTPVPLTGPAMASVMTSLPPHEHGATRNGIGMRSQLVTFTDILQRRGYRTAAFVGNWTLKPGLVGLAEHFETYEALLDRKRWFGLMKREATADDLNEAALSWLEDQVEDGLNRPLFLWIHYVEPHAPYELHREYVEQIGVKVGGSLLSPRNRYDSEIAFVDDRVGGFVKRTKELLRDAKPLVVFASDHGESLGEHAYWGHGRHLYEVTLHVPMGIAWPGRIAPQTVDAPAMLQDLAPTVLSLIGLPVPGHFQGFDWSSVLAGEEASPAERVTWHQAHRASIQPRESVEKIRERGLLAVGRVSAGKKEIYRVETSRHRIFSLAEDPGERNNTVGERTPPSRELQAWLRDVQQALVRADELPPPSLTDEDLDALRALGYID